MLSRDMEAITDREQVSYFEKDLDDLLDDSKPSEAENETGKN